MSFTLLQLSDCHLRDSKGKKLLGIDTEATFDQVLEQALSEHPVIDLIVFSGDISNDPSSRAYQTILDKLPAGINHAWLPGNHDDNSLMQQVVGNHFLCDVSLGQWQITLIDSSVTNEVSGIVTDREMARLSRVIKQHPNKHHAVFMHHHLVPINSLWMDGLMVKNASETLAFLARQKAIKIVANGHVHQEYKVSHKHLSIFSTPSTCFQFLPESEVFALDNQMPGYRAFTLFDDGRFDSRVFRLPLQKIPVDQKAVGY